MLRAAIIRGLLGRNGTSRHDRPQCSTDAEPGELERSSGDPRCRRHVQSVPLLHGWAVNYVWYIHNRARRIFAATVLCGLRFDDNTKFIHGIRARCTFVARAPKLAVRSISLKPSANARNNKQSQVGHFSTTDLAIVSSASIWSPEWLQAPIRSRCPMMHTDATT